MNSLVPQLHPAKESCSGLRIYLATSFNLLSLEDWQYSVLMIIINTTNNNNNKNLY